jgi:hypothetical protein
MLRLVLRFQKLEGDQYGEFTKDLQDTMLSLLKTRLKNAGDSTGPWSAFILHSVIDSYMDNDRFSFSIRLKNLYAGAKKTAAEKNLKLDNLSKMLEKMMFGFLIAEMEEDSRNNKIGLAMQKMQEYLTIDVPQEDKEKARAHFAQLVEQMQTIVPK